MKTFLKPLIVSLACVIAPPVIAQNVVEPESPELAPESAAAKKEIKPSYTVDSQNGLQFDSDRNVVTYLKNVVFKHPEQGLTVTCDKLEVVRNPNAGKIGPDGEPESDLKTAIAIGNVEIIKIDVEGKKKIGKSGRAVFDAVTNDVVMTKMPSLLENNNLIKATSPETVFILKESGKHDLKGPVTTQFASTDDKK